MQSLLWNSCWFWWKQPIERNFTIYFTTSWGDPSCLYLPRTVLFFAKTQIKNALLSKGIKMLSNKKLNEIQTDELLNRGKLFVLTWPRSFKKNPRGTATSRHNLHAETHHQERQHRNPKGRSTGVSPLLLDLTWSNFICWMLSMTPSSSVISAKMGALLQSAVMESAWEYNFSGVAMVWAIHSTLTNESCEWGMCLSMTPTIWSSHCLNKCLIEHYCFASLVLVISGLLIFANIQ